MSHGKANNEQLKIIYLTEPKVDIHFSKTEGNTEKN
jgi:hypothetical protein